MIKHNHNPVATVLIISQLCFMPGINQAQVTSRYLSVISSSNQESNAARSFVIIKEGELLKEGIKHTTKQQYIGLQTPLVIKYNKSLKNNIQLQWIIKSINKKNGSIKLISKFKGKARFTRDNYIWKSDILDSTVHDRQRLVFRPKPFKHQPVKYKKGRNNKNKRARYGGGTRKINHFKYNPQYAYDITLHVFNNHKRIFTHRTNLQMDYKDMIRQEYINHYNIKHHKAKDRGNIAIPLRSEIIRTPETPKNMEGNPLTESKYKFIINEGMDTLVTDINKHYFKYLNKINSKGGIVDLNKKRRKVPDNKLWISSGWRNPERNEWYSNKINGNHQRGSAVDIIIMAPSSSIESALGYWILWKSLSKNRTKIKGSWQLESNGIALTRKMYWQDIDPKNGIPDAFDKADHLHANVK